MSCIHLRVWNLTIIVYYSPEIRSSDSANTNTTGNDYNTDGIIITTKGVAFLPVSVCLLEILLAGLRKKHYERIGLVTRTNPLIMAVILFYQEKYFSLQISGLEEQLYSHGRGLVSRITIDVAILTRKDSLP